MTDETTQATSETSAAQTTSQASTTDATAAAAAATTGGADTQSATTQAAAEKPFYETWAADLKESPSVLRYKSAEDIARAYMAAEKKLGAPPDQLLRAPKGLDDKEGIAAIMKALGAPETADGYKFDLEGASEADKAVVTEFAKHMHDSVHAPPAVMKAAVDWWRGQVAKAAEADQQAAAAAAQAGEAALRKEWGAAYDARLAEVGRLMNENGGEAFYKDLEKAGLANHPSLLLMFGKMLDKMAEPGGLAGGARATTGELTPGQAKAKRLELEADPIKSKALNDSSHPAHKDVVEERRRYFKLERGLT